MQRHKVIVTAARQLFSMKFLPPFHTVTISLNDWVKIITQIVNHSDKCIFEWRIAWQQVQSPSQKGWNELEEEGLETTSGLGWDPLPIQSWAESRYWSRLTSEGSFCYGGRSRRHRSSDNRQRGNCSQNWYKSGYAFNGNDSLECVQYIVTIVTRWERIVLMSNESLIYVSPSFLPESIVGVVSS